MNNHDHLMQYTKEELVELIEIYAKNWIALDGFWFQGMEKEYGMDAAMKQDVAVWRRWTVTEAKRIKEFLHLPEEAGLEGLAAALRLRFYANLNRDSIVIDGNTLIYTMEECRVQSARARKGLPYHPCKAVGVVEYGEFARTIDSRISCECMSCYPDVTDESCGCRWKFTLNV